MWRRAGHVWAAVVALVLLTGGPAAADPELRVEPASGQPGDTVTVIGAGFEAGDVELRWDSESGPLLGTATGPGFSVDVVVPADAVPNSYPVVAVVRDGRAVSTSNTSFQVIPAEPEEEEPTTTTVADPVAGEPSPGRGNSEPVGGRSIAGGPSRGGLGVTGGLGGDATEPDLGTTAGQPATGSGTGAAGSETSPPSGDEATTTTGPPAAGPASDPAAPSDPTGAARTDEGAPEPSGAALSPRAAGQSSEAVRSPALLLVGLAMVFGGGAVLAVRNRQRAGEIEELQ